MTYNESACPRCDSSRIEKLADSPVSGAWEVWRCENCNFVWRTSEKLNNIIKYDQELANRARCPWPL